MSKVTTLRARSARFREAQIQRGGPGADSSDVIIADTLIEILASLEALQAALEGGSGATSPEKVAKSGPKNR